MKYKWIFVFCLSHSFGQNERLFLSLSSSSVLTITESPFIVSYRYFDGTQFVPPEEFYMCMSLRELSNFPYGENLCTVGFESIGVTGLFGGTQIVYLYLFTLTEQRLIASTWLIVDLTLGDPTSPSSIDHDKLKNLVIPSLGEGYTINDEPHQNTGVRQLKRIALYFRNFSPVSANFRFLYWVCQNPLLFEIITTTNLDSHSNKTSLLHQIKTCGARMHYFPCVLNNTCYSNKENDYPSPLLCRVDEARPCSPSLSEYLRSIDVLLVLNTYGDNATLALLHYVMQTKNRPLVGVDLPNIQVPDEWESATDFLVVRHNEPNQPVDLTRQGCNGI